MRKSLLFFVIMLIPAAALAQQQMDEAYAEKIREYTTDEQYLNPMIDHLPASSTVPSPMAHFGDIIGAPNVLHYTDEIYGYLRKVGDASPRVLVRNIGMTEENREMIEVIIANDETIANLDTYRTYLNQLADPRNLSEEEAQEIISKAKPIYYITCGLHSPETGSPEMIMEMTYRLAVSDDPMIKNIRDNAIVIFTPAAEPDGRDRMVDVINYRLKNDGVGPGLPYWGHYVAHDNNRDGYGLALALTRNLLQSYLHWKATVMHDLHESVPYLYVSTGLGPFNENIDPITVDEWHNLAFEEVSQLTREGMPGVWTHAFYNGWAANYLTWIANVRNGIGRFYETFGNSTPETVERTLTSRSTSKQWYRSNPPLKKTMWSLRNNTNYMQSGVLTALNYTANNRRRFVENFYIKTQNAIRKGKEEAPYAYVIPREQRRSIATLELVNLLRTQGLEVHVADENISWSSGKKAATNGKAGNGKADKSDTQKMASAAKGDFVIRLDQPYRTLARVLLDKQNFPKDQRPPYDDTGWTLPLLYQVEMHKVNDSGVLAAKMSLLQEELQPEGKVAGSGGVYLVNNTTDDNFTVLRFKLKDVKFHAAEAAFTAGKKKYAAGSFIIKSDDNDDGFGDAVKEAAEELGLRVEAVKKTPDVATHEVETPRIAFVHTWVSTPQDAGWWRHAFDDIGIPYTYLSEQDLATEDLSQFDVIVMPNSRANPRTLVQGNSMAGEPTPWKNTSEYKHIGKIDETDDTRRGMGFDGLKNLHDFISSGGVFITEGRTASFPIDMAMTRRVSVRRTQKLTVRGSVVRAEITDKKSPITYGYADTAAVYFSRGPVFSINKNLGGFRTPEKTKEAIWQEEVPRAVVNFAKKNILLSGMLSGESEMAGAPAIVDAPVGDGHVILFANRPFWRWETRGSHAFVFNAMLHWNDLRTGWPERPKDDAAGNRPAGNEWGLHENWQQ